MGSDPAFSIIGSDAATATTSAALGVDSVLAGDHFALSRMSGVGTIDVSVNVVSSPAFHVQGGTASFTPGSDTASIPISPLTSPGFVVSEGGVTDHATDANPGSSSATLELFPDHVAVQRGNTAGNAVVVWQVVELAP